MKAKAVRLHSAKISAGQFHKRIICQKAPLGFLTLWEALYYGFNGITKKCYCVFD